MLANAANVKINFELGIGIRPLTAIVFLSVLRASAFFGLLHQTCHNARLSDDYHDQGRKPYVLIK